MDELRLPWGWVRMVRYSMHVHFDRIGNSFVRVYKVPVGEKNIAVLL